jgi:hypothetical protein
MHDNPYRSCRLALADHHVKHTQLGQHRAPAQGQGRTQREQRLRAAQLGPAARNVQHLRQRHVRAPAGHRRLRKGAVAARVAAEPRERQEYLVAAASNLSPWWIIERSTGETVARKQPLARR